jgi:protein phosphatase
MRAEEMLQIVADSRGDLAAACDALIKEANKRGGEDNITVVLARFDGADLDAPAPEPINVELAALEDDPTLHGAEDDTSPIP